MPRVPRHALVWSTNHERYDLYIQGQLETRFHAADQAALLAWLGEVTSFAFHGLSGSLNVYHEARPRGGLYWYAYATRHGRTRKRYLGRTESISLARLEETARALSPAHQPSSAADQQATPIPLSTSLAPPRLPNPLVERPHLLAALDGALSTPLTLLSATAGWGKTTLLTAWTSQRKAYVAWLSLDELDNSSTHFWVSLIASLRRSGRYAPSLGESALALLQSPQPPPLAVCLSALLNELESHETHPAPIVLVLDDYQVITNPAIHQGLSFWLEHLPAHVHLILSSRVDPDLPLARLRAQGQMTEIRAADLRLTSEETSHFLSRMLSTTLDAEAVRLLVNRTEGWIAGVQLAALAMRKRADHALFLQSFAGSQRYLLDYVQEEIFARLPTSVRDFLLHVAILSRLNATVCQAVTAESTTAACQHMLSFLERHNLFLVPLDEERRWYRLHDLFREALLAALHATHPETAPVLHRRAATFYEAQGEWSEAIAHRLAAADFSVAARLMEQTAEQFWLRGEAATMANWVLVLPARLVREHARLVLTSALYLLFTTSQATGDQRARAHAEARQLMARAETALPPGADETICQTSAPQADVHADASAGVSTDIPENREAYVAERTLLQQRLRLLRMFLVFLEATASGDYERLNSMQQEIQEALDRSEEAIWQMVPLSCSFVLHVTVWREGVRLLPRLLDAQEQVSRSGSHFATIKVRQWLALAALDAGRLRLAYEESQAARGMIEEIAGYALLKGYFEIVHAEVLYQWNRLEEARGRLRTALRDAAAWQQLDILSWEYATLMRVELASGEWSEAQQVRHELEQQVRREHYGGYSGWLPTMRAEWWLARGQLKEASDWAASVTFPEAAWEGPNYSAFPVVVRVYFAQRRWTEALELLEHWSRRLDRPTDVAMTNTFLAQYMVALHQTGKREQAKKVAARLFALTEPEGYIRIYLDEGEPMRQALQALLTPRAQHQRHHQRTSSATTAYITKLLAAFDHDAHGASTALEAVAPLLPSAPALTRREQEVLRLLATGASNQDIAQTLVISLATVKKHVSNLLGKLGATSRTQAIAQARARSLL